MKAQRRHELQHNTLSLWLANAPEYLRQHGSKILLVIILVVLGIILWKQYKGKAEHQVAEANANLVLAQTAIDKLQSFAGTPDQAAEALKRVNVILADTKEPQLRARAYVTKGNYYWALANYHPFTSQDTPSMTPEEALKSAEDSYQTVLREYAGQAAEVAASRLALGAIEENRAAPMPRKLDAPKPATAEANQHWDLAKGYFEAVRDDAAAPAVLRDEAKRQLTDLARAHVPVEIAPPKPPTTGPSTAMGMGPFLPPSATAPASGPATATSKPALETTRP